MLDQKEAVRKVVHGYLMEAHAECLPEFNAVFDSVYGGLERRESDDIASDSLPNEDAVSFDAGAGQSALVALACSVGYVILRAALKDFVKRDLPSILDDVEARLAKATGRAEMITAIRQRVEGILQSM